MIMNHKILNFYKNGLTFINEIVILKRHTKTYIMQPKEEKKVHLGDINPLEICERIGLSQKLLREQPGLNPRDFGLSSDAIGGMLNDAFQAFLRDFMSENHVQQEKSLLNPESVSLFIYAILQAESRHECRKNDKKLSSLNHLFKDTVDGYLQKLLKSYSNVKIGEDEYYAITKFLHDNKLIVDLTDGFSITQELARLIRTNIGYLVL